MSAKFFRRFTKRILIIINIIVAILFLLGCYSGWFNPRYFWFIGLLTLGSLYFIGILGGFLLFWIFAKIRWSLISIIAFILAWQPMQEIIKLKIKSDFVVKKHPAHIRLLTWNVEHFSILEHKNHPERKQEMIDLINYYNPDIVCFQEMVGSEKKEAINYIGEFQEKLKMPYYHYSYNKKLDFDNDHHFGIIIMSRLPVVKKVTFSYDPNDYNSIFQYVDFLKENDTFRVVNLHLQSMKFSTDNIQYIENPSLSQQEDLRKTKSVLGKLRGGFLKRKTQSEHIKKTINQSPHPIIVCGDFNDVPNSYAYYTIGKGLKNAFTEKGNGIGRTFSGISPTLRIDHIFADKKFTVEQYVRINRRLSDHFPVIADLYYNKPE